MQFETLDIVNRCKQNDPRAQEAFYRHCYPGMIKVCLRYSAGNLADAGSLYNAAMLRVFSKIGQYRGDGELMGWVRQTVVRVCIDKYRENLRFATASVDDVAEPPSVVPDIYQRLSGAEIMQLVQGLPKNTGLVFNLFVMEGYRHEEIGKMLGITSGTSKWHLAEARRQLRERLDYLFKQENLRNVI